MYSLWPPDQGGALGVPDARGSHAARHRGPDGHRWPQVQGWVWTATQDHRLSGLGTSSAGAQGPHTSPGSGADGEPRKCLAKRLEAASRCPCRAWPPRPPGGGRAGLQPNPLFRGRPAREEEAEDADGASWARTLGPGGAGSTTEPLTTPVFLGAGTMASSVPRTPAGGEHTVDGRMDGRTRSRAAWPELASLPRGLAPTRSSLGRPSPRLAPSSGAHTRHLGKPGPGRLTG